MPEFAAAGDVLERAIRKRVTPGAVIEVGGRSVLPYQPPGLWEEVAYGAQFTAQRYQQSHGKDLYRRGMYSFWKRTLPPASLAIFDAPDREKCVARRATTMMAISRHGTPCTCHVPPIRAVTTPASKPAANRE